MEFLRVSYGFKEFNFLLLLSNRILAQIDIVYWGFKDCIFTVKTCLVYKL